jgi:hypothetical protein
MATAMVHRSSAAPAATPKVVTLRGGDRVRRETPEAVSFVQHDFPAASTIPPLPPMPDQLLDFYGFVFCQGGFRNLGMSFEHFLMVVAAFGIDDASGRSDDFVESAEETSLNREW